MTMQAHLRVGLALGVAVAAGGCGTSGSTPTGTAGTTGGAGTGGAGSTGGAGFTGLASLAECSIFPADDAWNTDVSGQAVDAMWTQRLNTLAGSAMIHPDFGDTYGIPINAVPASQPAVPIVFDDYPGESDPGPYPFPPGASVLIEGGPPATCAGDCHVLVVQTGTCMLYEGYGCKFTGGVWHCANGATWDLKKTSYGQRPKGWTSADAAGLPVMPGILRRAEAVAGPLKHAIRFTMRCTTNKYVKPATHYAVPSNAICDPKNPSPTMPPMGMRVRLKASYDSTGASTVVQNILVGLKHHGMILADNGSNFFFQGDPDPGWTNEELSELKAVPASAFEVVEMPPLEP